MARLGAHLSISGGLPRAVDRAEASGCAALQIFTKSAGQWRARELPPDEIAPFKRRVRQRGIRPGGGGQPRPRAPPPEERALFKRRVRETGTRPVVAHNSYLINRAAADAALR